MEFNCPACDAPHAFPDDQIPESGIVVACTSCSEHITLTRQGVAGAEADPEPPPPAPSPPRKPSAPPSPPPSGGLEATSAMLPARDIDDAGWPKAAEPAQPEPSPEPAPEKPQPEPEPAAAPTPEERKHDDFVSSAASSFKSAARGFADRGRKAFDEATGEEMEAETDVPEGLAFPGFRASEGDWSWKDLPRAFMGVFDTRRVLFATAGFWAALVSFALLQWLGGWLGAKVTGVLATVFSIAAWGVAVAIAAFVAAVIGYVCHQVVIEQRPSSIKSGIAWTKEWIKSVVGTPLAFAGVVAAAAVIEGVVGVLGRIPFAGPIIWGLATPAIVVLSLAAGAVLLALVYSLPLYIPVVYNEKTGPMETLKRLLHLFRTHGFELVGYVLLSIFMIFVAFAVTVFPAWTIPYTFLTGRVAGAAMGENLMGVVAEAPNALKGFILLVVNPASVPFSMPDTGFGHTLGGLLAGIGTAVAPALIFALLALAYYTAGCVIYAIVTGRKK